MLRVKNSEVQPGDTMAVSKRLVRNVELTSNGKVILHFLADNPAFQVSVRPADGVTFVWRNA